MAAGVGLVLATVVPAMAANTCTNRVTGPTSNNYCNRMVEKFQNLRVDNFGTINHSALLFTNTGNNTSDNNTNVSGNLSIETNDADVTNAESMVSLNTGNLDVDQSDVSVDEQGENDTTGPDSNNTVTFNTTKNMTVNVSNNGTVDHNVEIMANTGYNSASHNTNVGAVKTGKASIVATIMSALNDTVIKIKQ